MTPTHLSAILLAISAPAVIAQAEPASAAAPAQTAVQLEKAVETALQKGDAAAYEKAAQALYDYWNGLVTAAYDPIMKRSPLQPSDEKGVARYAVVSNNELNALLKSQQDTQKAWLAYRQLEDEAYDFLDPEDNTGSGVVKRPQSLSAKGDKLLFQAARAMERVHIALHLSLASPGKVFDIEIYPERKSVDTETLYMPGPDNDPLLRKIEQQDNNKLNYPAIKKKYYLIASYWSTKPEQYMALYLNLGWPEVTRQQHAAVQKAWEKYRDCVFAEFEPYPWGQGVSLFRTDVEIQLSRQRAHDILQYMGILPYPKANDLQFVPNKSSLGDY